MGSCLSNPRPRRGCSPEPRRSPSAPSMILSPWGRTWSRAPSLTPIAMGCSRCRSARGPCTGGHPIPGLCCPSTGWSCRGPCAGPVATSRSGSTRPSLTSWPVAPIRSARRAGSTPTCRGVHSAPRAGLGALGRGLAGRRTRWRAVRRGHRRPVCGRVHVPPGAGRLEGRPGRAGRAVVRRPAQGARRAVVHRPLAQPGRRRRCRARTIWRDCPTFWRCPGRTSSRSVGDAERTSEEPAPEPGPTTDRGVTSPKVGRMGQSLFRHIHLTGDS